jgi:endonuclease-8
VPEGHTLHLIARDHRRRLVGRPLSVTSPQGRAADAAERVSGSVLEGVDAHGKHLFYEWSTGDVLHIHLGIFGHFLDGPSAGPNVRWRMATSADDGPPRTIDLVGPTACELLKPDEADAVAARLGPDPLRPDADPELAWSRLRRRKVGIGQVLMDQSVFAGVGNIFRAEALFVNGIHPDRPANTLTREEFDALYATVARMLKQAMKDKRIVTVARNELPKPVKQLDRLEGRYVYRQENCFRCGTPVRRWDLAGRWCYVCETCQPPP